MKLAQTDIRFLYDEFLRYRAQLLTVDGNRVVRFTYRISKTLDAVLFDAVTDCGYDWFLGKYGYFAEVRNDK
jgi:hypothetical protein